MKITEMENKIIEAGWQYTEHIFNDGPTTNCFIQFSKSTNPHVLGSYDVDSEERRNVIGSGRFSAWQQAYDYIILRVRN